MFGLRQRAPRRSRPRCYGEPVQKRAESSQSRPLLLRHSVIDGLGIDQIAAIYHVHRATAARQLKQARTTLVDATRERMRIALRVSETELESIMRMIMSLADITLQQVLARGDGPAQESE